ncbi:DUF262 domain-containing protein [Rhizobium sp. Leaf383]|uniref:DUF262 domain-containing protein n=1 Tax=Rhizobium sp. Leaf383 TaxID=1736357 RepID=UPI001AEC60C5|nr:DUF262 domain-containing protein [Rhizobium sp. Leaf383]
MDSGLKVTDTPEESSFSDIVAGDNVINIPLFQREYKWTEKNLSQFWQDIEEILDGTKQSQFLGVIVTVRQPSQIGRPTIYDIVDGQQRLFTCYLAIMAAVRAALDEGKKEWALEVARTFLLLRPFSQHPTNTKLVPSAADRQQFKLAWDDIAAHSVLKEKGSWDVIGKPTPPHSSGPSSGKLIQQYIRLVRRFRKTFTDYGFERVEKTLQILTGSLSFVSISLRNPIAAPIIFERLNARGERITTADLVRNEIFSRVASEPTLAQVIFNNDWEPFQRKFLDAQVDLEKLLFPYGLALNHNTTKADLFSVLRVHWNTFEDTTDIIIDMDRFAPTIIALEKGLTESLPNELRQNILRLHRLGAPSSIYSFVCLVSDAASSGRLEVTTAREMLDVIEAFLARRAICGHEPTGLHAVFKGLWPELAKEGDLSATGVSKSIRKRPTIAWPSDQEFEHALRFGDLYSRKVCRYVLSEFELSEHGETPSDSFWIEHIMPQKLTDEWAGLYSEDQHKSSLNTFANLIPLTSKMNNDEGQNAFQLKRVAYKDSIFSTARSLALQFETWSLDDLNTRANRIVEWSLHRWKK